MNKFINLILSFIIILLVILSFYWKLSKFLLNEHFNIKNYKSLMLNNNNENLFKISLENIPILEEDCFEKCDSQNCIKLDQQRKNLEKCIKCNNTKNKCFKKSVIGGLCDDCDIEDINDKINCYDINNYGCTNPNNLQINEGIKPYFIEIPDNNVNSPYNKKCVFCWNILNEI